MKTEIIRVLKNKLAERKNKPLTKEDENKIYFIASTIEQEIMEIIDNEIEEFIALEGYSDEDK